MSPRAAAVDSFRRRAWRRLRPSLGVIVLTALAAGAAWFFAGLIPGHTMPLFAPIAALVAMSAGRGQRGRAAVELIIGVAFGIALADLFVRVVGTGAWQLIVVTGLTMAVATMLGLSPFMVTQSGVWAVIVVASTHGRLELALSRFEDALVGGGVALILAQLLFPLDPLKHVGDAAREMRRELYDVLHLIADALRRRDEQQALGALSLADRVDDRQLESALALGREVVRRAPRRRPLRRKVDAYAELAHGLHAATRDLRMLAVGAIRLIRSGAPIPPELPEAIDALARGEAPPRPQVDASSLAAGIVAEQIESFGRRLQVLEQGDSPEHDGRRTGDRNRQ
jgi:uncharacterized membrane protein YccC